MSSQSKNAQLLMVPVEKIEVLNPRERNQKVFEEIVENIRQIGLKKPITVTPRLDGNGETKYLLVCGEGRLKAFKVLGELEIPAMVVDVDDDDAFIISLAENIARRQCTTKELLSGIQRLKDQGFDKRDISEKTGLRSDYVQGILKLLENGEDRLLSAVDSGKIPLKVALEISKVGDDDKASQVALQEAYESGKLRGKQLIFARQLIAKRQAMGKSTQKRGTVRSAPNVTSSSLIRSYQKEVERQRLIIRKSDVAQEQLMFVIGALRSLLSSDHFITLLRAEGLDTLPTFLAKRVWPSGLTV